ncbi:MAG TPA: filamentous hemagglutinin N-terminal domain-containing protein, partial [Gallionella sp.]|nr:filamentous hemagglutinin N-terminal domain-containing protein [Gallionella sp.]
MRTAHHYGTWQRNAVAVAVASCFVITSPVYANPIGANVVNGAVSISQQGNALNITNSPGSIIHWQSFSIGANEATRFIQQSAASSVLNRVTGVDPSSILGALQSNGRVFLINPNGVLFGAGAQVDVAGLVVSTLNLSNADFLAGRYHFTAHTGAGGIDNQGNLTALPGGQIYLVAPNLSNSGVITSLNGDILLAAGNSVELVNANSPDMRVVIDAPNNQVLNLGSIVANSGRIGIYAGLINHHGIVSADTATVGATGKVMFLASKDINLEPGSVVSASGTPGGVHDGGEVRLIADGKLAMRNGAQVRVDGGVDGGNGGFLELSGHQGFLLVGDFSGKAKVPGFHGGRLLLDPTNININSGCGA